MRRGSFSPFFGKSRDGEGGFVFITLLHMGVVVLSLCTLGEGRS